MIIKCQAKTDQSWCLDGFESLKSKYDVIVDETFSNHPEYPIQIKPQKVKLSLRKGEKFILKFQYKMTENFPVDLYYLMDLSYSMYSSKATLAKLGNELARAMRNLTSNFRLGFGSFIDKVEMPYSVTTKEL